MKRYWSILILLVLLIASTAFANMQSFTKEKIYSNNFSDVQETAWYYDSVKEVFELNLFNGISNDSFGPDSNITIAQAIKLASTIHSIYNNDNESFKAEDGEQWYIPYVKYALNKKIIANEYLDYDTNATRSELVKILVKSLPDEELKAINEIELIPDVSISDKNGEDIYKFYNAGILSGSDKQGTFNPQSNIKRCEVAAIITRLVNSQKRLSFSIDSVESSDNEYLNIEFGSLLKRYNDIEEYAEMLDNGQHWPVSSFIKECNGKKVQIKGFPTVERPNNNENSSMFICEYPFVNNPFRLNTSRIIMIYMPSDSNIDYTTEEIIVYGTLEITDTTINTAPDSNNSTPFKIKVDKIENIIDSNVNKNSINYFKDLLDKGIIYDIEDAIYYVSVVSTSQYWKAYELNDLSIDRYDYVALCKNIAKDYLEYDSEYGKGYGSGFAYLDYIKECPSILKGINISNDTYLMVLNDDLINIFNNEIVLLEKYQDICYKIHILGDSLQKDQAIEFLSELQELWEENTIQYNSFFHWYKKLATYRGYKF